MSQLRSRKCSVGECAHEGFDVQCVHCQARMWTGKLSLEKFFAVLRTWDASVQMNVDQLVEQFVQNNGPGVLKEFDPMLGMNLLMYCVRAGAVGLGDDKKASRIVRWLIEKKGADVGTSRSELLGMNCVHLAAFFDCPKVLEVLISCVEPGLAKDLINERIEESGQTALHLASSNLSSGAMQVLIRCGCANLAAMDHQGRTAQECIGIDQAYADPNDPRIRLINMMTSNLMAANTSGGGDDSISSSDNRHDSMQSEVLFEIGDRVHLTGKGNGTVRYIGEADFSNGIWCGIELDDCRGKNDGSIQGKKYFSCRSRYGIFARPSKIKRLYD